MSDAFQPRGLDFRVLPLSAIPPGGLADSLAIWRSWCRGRTAPAWEDVQLYALPADVLPLATVVDVLDGGRDFRYRYWGTELSELFGREETGLLLSKHAVHASGKLRFDQFGRVVTERKPQFYITVFETTEGVLAEKMNLRMPLCAGDGRVDKILTLSSLNRIGLKADEDLSAHYLGRTGT